MFIRCESCKDLLLYCAEHNICLSDCKDIPFSLSCNYYPVKLPSKLFRICIPCVKIFCHATLDKDNKPVFCNDGLERRVIKAVRVPVPVYQVRGRKSAKCLPADVYPWCLSRVTVVYVPLRCHSCREIDPAADRPYGDDLPVPHESCLRNVYPYVKRHVAGTYALTVYNTYNIKVPAGFKDLFLFRGSDYGYRYCFSGSGEDKYSKACRDNSGKYIFFHPGTPLLSIKLSVHAKSRRIL